MDQTLSPLTENTRRSIAAHDYEFALVAIVFYATNALARGMELASLSRELAARLADVTPLKHVTAVNIARFIQQVLASLLGHGDSHEGSDDAQFDEPRRPGGAREHLYAARVLRGVVQRLPRRRPTCSSRRAATSAVSPVRR